MQRKDVRLHPHTRCRAIDRFSRRPPPSEALYDHSLVCTSWAGGRAPKFALRFLVVILGVCHRGTAEAPCGSALIDREHTFFGAHKLLCCMFGGFEDTGYCLRRPPKLLAGLMAADVRVAVSRWRWTVGSSQRAHACDECRCRSQWWNRTGP